MIDGHLHVADVTVEDARMAYRCHARHRLAAASSARAVSSPPARIVMRGIVDDHAHPFQQPLDDLPDDGTAPLPPAGPPRLVAPGRRIVHAKLGQDVAHLTCRIAAHPPAKIRSDPFILPFVRLTQHDDKELVFLRGATLDE